MHTHTHTCTRSHNGCMYSRPVVCLVSPEWLQQCQLVSYKQGSVCVNSLAPDLSVGAMCLSVTVSTSSIHQIYLIATEQSTEWYIFSILVRVCVLPIVWYYNRHQQQHAPTTASEQHTHTQSDAITDQCCQLYLVTYTNGTLLSVCLVVLSTANLYFIKRDKSSKCKYGDQRVR